MPRSTSATATIHLTLGNFTNVATVANAETIVGGSAADTITVTTAAYG